MSRVARGTAWGGLSQSHPFEAGHTHSRRKGLAGVFFAVCHSLPRLWFLEPSRSLVTGHRAAHTAWVLPAMTVFCPPPEMPPVAPSRPRPRCRHPLLMQRAGSPPCSVPPAPRIQAPVATRLHGVSVPGTGGIRVTRSGGGDCPVHQDPMSGHPPTSSHCDNQTHLQTGCPLRNGSVPLGLGHFQDR